MMENLCGDFLRYLANRERLRIGPSPKHVVQWLERSGVPTELHRLLRHNYLQKSDLIGHFWWRSAAEITKLDRQTQLMRQRFLQIGSALNGDLLVIDYAKPACEVGLVCFDHFWGSVGPKKARSIYERIAPSLEALLYRIVDELYLPLDYYCAGDVNSLLREEGAEQTETMQPMKIRAGKRPTRGRRRFVVLPHEQYTAMQQRLADAEDAGLLQESRERQARAVTISLAEMKRRLGMTRRRRAEGNKGPK